MQFTLQSQAGFVDAVVDAVNETVPSVQPSSILAWLIVKAVLKMDSEGLSCLVGKGAAEKIIHRQQQLHELQRQRVICSFLPRKLNAAISNQDFGARRDRFAAAIEAAITSAQRAAAKQ